MAGSRKGVTDFLGIKPNYGKQGSQTIADEAREFATITQGNALATNAGMKARADIESAKHYAAAEAAIGAAQGQAALVGGIASGVKGLAGFMPEGGLGGNSLGDFDPSTSTSNLFGNNIGSFGGGTPLGPLR